MPSPPGTAAPAAAAGPSAPARDVYRARRIFVASSMALFAAGLSFALRAATLGTLQRDYLAPLDASRAGEMAGWLAGIAFLGFGVALGVGSTFLNAIGMGRMLVVAAACFIAGTLLAVAAPLLAAGAGLYTLLLAGFLLSGVGWGLVEASINPLVAALHPGERVARLNTLHAWWPAGLVIGGLWSVGLSTAGLGWQPMLLLVVLPASGALALCLGVRFPPTERARAGVGFGEMLREIVRQPMFLVWWACMFLTAAAELAPGQWVDLTLSRTVGMRGIWLLVHVSAMMFVLRHFAGAISQRLSPLAMLWASSLLATAGLLLLPRADSPLTGLASATVWGLGVCFLWPTMLANVSLRYPRGGEFFVGLMGVAGALSIQFVLPLLGRVFDRAAREAAGGEAALARLASADGEALDAVLRQAAQASFETLAWLPAILVGVFGAIALADRRRAHPRARAAATPPD